MNTPLIKSFNDHRLGRNEFDHTIITSFKGFRELFGNFICTFVHLVFDFSEFASDVRGVAIENWSLTIHDFIGVVHDDDLSLEELSISSWYILSIRYDVNSLNMCDGETLNV